MKLAILVFSALLTALVPAIAQDWPAKVVRIVVPFGPGSTPDIVARLISDHLQQKYPASSFVIENKPGASGNTGTDAVAKAAPDGATIGVSIGGPLAINTLLFGKLSYDPAKDIAPVTQLITMPSALAVNPELGVNNVAELMALLKKEPGKYNFGSIGNGSLSHLTMEAIAQKSGAKLVHIPYPSSPAAMTALIRGDVQMAALPAISVTPHVATGKAKILAVTLPTRSPFLPEIPDSKGIGNRCGGRYLDGPDCARQHAARADRCDPQGCGRGDHLESRSREASEPVYGAGRKLTFSFSQGYRRRDRALGANHQGGGREGELGRVSLGHGRTLR